MGNKRERGETDMKLGGTICEKKVKEERVGQ